MAKGTLVPGFGHSNYFPKHFVIVQFVKGFAVLQRRVFYVWHFRLCRSLRCCHRGEWRNRYLRSADCGTSKQAASVAHSVAQASKQCGGQAGPHWGAHRTTTRQPAQLRPQTTAAKAKGVRDPCRSPQQTALCQEQLETKGSGGQRKS